MVLGFVGKICFLQNAGSTGDVMAESLLFSLFAVLLPQDPFQDLATEGSLGKFRHKNHRGGLLVGCQMLGTMIDNPLLSENSTRVATAGFNHERIKEYTKWHWKKCKMLNHLKFSWLCRGFAWQQFNQFYNQILHYLSSESFAMDLWESILFFATYRMLWFTPQVREHRRFKGTS